MIRKKPKSIRILAGPEAYAQIKARGLCPDDIDIVTGAAGGPKWLALSNIDRLLFGEWFRDRKKPLHLVGASAGAWRLAAAATADPLQTIKCFEELYIDQQYALRPSAAEVSRKSIGIIDGFLGTEGSIEILSHPTFRLRVLVNRCKGLLASERANILKISMGSIGIGSLLYKPAMASFIDRFIGFDARTAHPVNETVKNSSYQLSEQNLIPTLLASGSIPVVMQGVRDIAGAGAGVFRDGGLLDYHIDLPFDLRPGGLILCPHFISRIIPGWFDRFAPWRKAQHAARTVLIAPTDEFIKTLPNQKIPCRKDFWFHAGRDQERKKEWGQAVNSCQRMADELNELLQTGNIGSCIEPLI